MGDVYQGIQQKVTEQASFSQQIVPTSSNSNPITQDGWRWEWGSCVLRLPRHLAVSLQPLPVHKGWTVTTITDFYISVLPQKVRLKNAWVQITSFPSISILCSIKKEAAQREVLNSRCPPVYRWPQRTAARTSHRLYPCLSMDFCDLNILTFLTQKHVNNVCVSAVSSDFESFGFTFKDSVWYWLEHQN